MTDENADDEGDDEDEARDKHAIRGGTEFVEKLLTGDDEDDEGTDE